MIDKFIHILRESNIHLHERELVDVLWLSRFLPSDTVEQETAQDDFPVKSSDPHDKQERSDDPVENKTSSLTNSNIATDRNSLSASSTIPTSNNHSLFTNSSSAESDIHRKRVSAIRVPGAPALPNVLQIRRALRPFTRRWKSQRDSVLDEEETTQVSSETQFLYPVFKPALERWFDIALVVEDTPSMVVWQQLVHEFALMLESNGTFRDVRVWRIKAKDEKVSVCDISGLDRAPESLNDPASRRMIILLSDCSSKNWQYAPFINVLRDWAGKMPVVVGHLLSEKLWRNTALGQPNVRVKATLPAQANKKLTYELPWNAEYEKTDWGYMPLPIINLNQALIGQWASMLMNPGVVYNNSVLLTPSVKSSKFTNNSKIEENYSPERKVQRFEALVSEEARDLAIYLSILPLSTLTLPVIRLVQAAMLPRPEQEQIAELLLGGVMKRCISDEQQTQGNQEENIEYIFFDGVKEILERKIFKSEIHRVLQCASKVIEQRIGTPFDFLAYLENPEGGIVTPQAAPFVSLAQQVLQRLGISYAKLSPASIISTTVTQDNITNTNQIDFKVTVDKPTDVLSARDEDKNQSDIENLRVADSFHKARTVFISYSTKDIEIAKKVKARLEEHGIEVTIDRSSLPAGGNILDYIDQSIRETQITLSIISPNSLASDWVAFESVQSFAAAKYVDEKEFIACYIDDAFLTDPDFHIKALAAINEQIAQIRAEIRKVERQGVKFASNLTTKIQRKQKLKNNLDVILHRLQEVLTLDIREPEFDASMSRIIKIILRQPVDPTDEFREKYLRAFEQRSKNDPHQLDKRFVQLTLMIDKEERRWMEPPDSLQSIADIIQLSRAEEYPLMVILGAPGSGKSTILRRLALDYHRAEIGAGVNRLSFFVPLNRYEFESLGRRVTPKEFLESEWKTAYEDTGRSLESLLEEGRLLLLLDAINEIKHSSQNEYRDIINIWRIFAYNYVKRGNRIIFTCRSLDYYETLSSELLPVLYLKVLPLSPEQVDEFLQVYLPKRDREVFEQIKRSKTLDFYNNPYFLSLLCEQVDETGTVPKGRASLLTRYVWLAMRRELENGYLKTSDLLSKDDRAILNHTKGAGDFHLPDEGPLPDRLSHLAYKMEEGGRRNENQQIYIEKKKAMELIGTSIAEKIIEAGIAINVLEFVRGMGMTYRHQLLQEYFAARWLAKYPKPELVKVEWSASKVRPSLAETIAGLANGDPLPPPGQTGWEETTLAALPMSGDPEGYLARLIEYNLPLAARCAISPEVMISEKTKALIREKLVNRTQDMTADLRARIAAGEALGLIGDPRLKPSRTAEGECLLPLMADIRAGVYPIGDDHSGFDDERPAHKVELPTYQIGVFPVTNAEYAKFIEAGGYEDERWWDTATAQRWRREGGSEDQKQSFRNERWRWQNNWTDDQIKSMVSQGRATEEQVEGILWIRNASEEEFERQIDEWFPAGILDRTPRFWEDASYNNPEQPVVGVSWYEARAYCKWISQVTGVEYRLPTEVEYEAAASGREGREYAYGNEFDSTRCNTFESHIRRPTPIGIFDNRTPEGVCDLTGNVWTWTSTIYDQAKYPYPYNPGDGRELTETASGSEEGRSAKKTTKGSLRVLRGGVWDRDAFFCRSAYRERNVPGYRDKNLGFRLARALP